MIRSNPDLDEIVVWHDVECGPYVADLPVWEELAAAQAREGAGASVLELGCGTGRVALHLAVRGHRVTGVDSSPALLDAFRARAESGGLPARPLRSDVRDLRLDPAFDLVVAPMQLTQLLDRSERRAMLTGVAAALAPGGAAAFAVMDEPPRAWRAGPDAPAPAPDVREIDGWVFASLPTAIEPGDAEVRVHRLRRTVSPGGELSEAQDVVRLHELSPAGLEREAEDAGLRPRDRRSVPATDDHLGSTIVTCEAPR